VIVEQDADQQAGRVIGIELLEEGYELARTVTLGDGMVDKAGDEVDGRRKRDCAKPFVFVVAPDGGLTAYLEPQWPGLAQVCRIIRTRCIRGVESTETGYAITSLAAPVDRPAKLLALLRNHWGIENRLHHVREVNCRENQCRTRAGAAP
jgi:hypothetical protein